MIDQKSKIKNQKSDDPVEALQEAQAATLNILEDFNAEKLRLEASQRAVLNILDDFDNEKNHLERAQSATFNILEDFNAEKLRLEASQRAALNILDDFDNEKVRLERAQSATFNILEDFNAEKLRLEASQRAVLNILDDFDNEKSRLEKTQRATSNILEDFDSEKTRLEASQRATLNILDDFNAEKSLLEGTQRAALNILDDLNQSNEGLQRAHDVLELRVVERTTELEQSNEQLRAEMEERNRAEEELRRRTDELAKSNDELEQFAYIASHDLQEPLRMISSYVQLLEKRYRGKLDDDADEFIGYAADGALRMQRLINDLLAYSRVGTRGKTFEEVDLEAALAKALENLHLTIQEKNAVVTHDPLPVVQGDSGQLTQLFQNLIDNAIKFRREESPRVHISARLEGGECLCSVQDNGIGIAAEFMGRLFLLFQRLHTRKEYPGTGIGLAICKRIVERHGGKIWVESTPDEGSTFCFKIPAANGV